jgi:hypothetical protein
MSSIFGPSPFGPVATPTPTPNPTPTPAPPFTPAPPAPKPNTSVFQDRIVLQPSLLEDEATALGVYSGSLLNQADPSGNLDFRSANEGDFDLPRLFANIITGSGVANLPIVGIAPEPPKLNIYASYLSNIPGEDTTGGPAGNITMSDPVILQSNTAVTTLVFRADTNDTANFSLQPYDRATKYTMSLSFDFTPSSLSTVNGEYESIFSIGGTNRFSSNTNPEWQAVWLEVNSSKAKLVIDSDRIPFAERGDTNAIFEITAGNITDGQTHHFQCDVFTADVQSQQSAEYSHRPTIFRRRPTDAYARKL